MKDCSTSEVLSKALSESLVAAIIIGDGCVDKRGCIKIKHCLEQASYLEYKRDLLVEMGFRARVRTRWARSGFNAAQPRMQIEMETNVTAYGKALRSAFYPEGKKVMPHGAAIAFGWLEWAIIFQDDGRTNAIAHANSLIKGKRTRVECRPFVNRYEFCLPGFTGQGYAEMRASLKALGVDSSLITRRDGQVNMVITKAASKVAFYEGVRHHMQGCMLYKLAARPTMSYRK